MRNEDWLLRVHTHRERERLTLVLSETLGDMSHLISQPCLAILWRSPHVTYRIGERQEGVEFSDNAQIFPFSQGSIMTSFLTLNDQEREKNSFL